MKQKDRLIQKTMEEKKKLVAELLDLPLNDYETIVDVSLLIVISAVHYNNDVLIISCLVI